MQLNMPSLPVFVFLLSLRRSAHNLSYILLASMTNIFQAEKVSQKFAFINCSGSAAISRPSMCEKFSFVCGWRSVQVKNFIT